MKSTFSLATLAAAVLLPLGAAAAEPAGNVFFALSNGTRGLADPTPDRQVGLLKELGYEGISCSGPECTPEMFAALRRHGLKMSTVYLGLNLDGDRPALDRALAEVLPQLDGSDTILWLYIRSSKLKPSDAAGDARAVELVREVAGQAAARRLRVALYPHLGFWLERVEDAVRIAKKSQRQNVGVTFNLCHWLIKDGPDGAAERLKLAGPYLMVVTINGIDRDVTVKNRKGWIMTLDQGTFDVAGFLSQVRQVGFAGPIGLQCYAIEGDPRENLRRSMAAWRRMQP